MSQQITFRPVFPLDRRRLTEAKIARECELMRLEAVVKPTARRDRRADSPAPTSSGVR